MLRTLHGKLSLVLLALLGLLVLFFVPLTLLSTQRYFEEVNQKVNRTLAAHLTQHLVAKKGLGKDVRARAATMNEIHRLMVINPNIEIYLLDAQGAILDHAAPHGRVKRERVALEPVLRFLAGTEPLPIRGDDPRNLRGRKVFSATPITIDGQRRGYIYVILAGEEHEGIAERLRRSYILRGSLAAAVGGLLFAFATGLLLFHLLTRRLRRLAAAVDEFQERDFRERARLADVISSPPRDEIDRLGLAYNQMSGRILEQIEGLRAVDTQRREMVSHASHDLRTPLAALQGYLETLLIKEGELSAEEQRTYLTTALRHSDRLGKLVAELFELAKLESREAQVHAEPFSPGELVQDIALKFQLGAQNKKLRLETDFSPDVPHVCADIGLIERVLENLLENALRYTPEGGVVTLALTREGENIRVQVRDTGRGIPEEHLPYIFDRYYRVESQPETPGGAGLGLAIAKRILELHDSTITVQSVPGGGTTLTFTLPVCPPQPEA